MEPGAESGPPPLDKGSGRIALAKRKLPLIPEHLLARLWQTRAQRRSLSTADGRRVRVLYPGRRNGGPGPRLQRTP